MPTNNFICSSWLENDDALAGRLGVENAVGLVGLLELPAVREQRVDVDAVVDREARALELPHRAEGPRADDGELLAQHVAAHVEGDVAALAHEAHRAPGLRAAHRR